MKRHVGLVLTSVLLIFALAACGGDKKEQQDDGQTHDTVLDGTEDALDDAKDTLEDAGDALLDPSREPDRKEEHREEDTLRKEPEDSLDRDNTSDEGSGVSFGQMLQNARVHDTDGFLKDGENSVTPGAA